MRAWTQRQRRPSASAPTAAQPQSQPTPSWFGQDEAYRALTSAQAPARETVQRAPSSSPRPGGELAAALQGGEALEPSTQAWASSAFKVDFSQVRIHRDSAAAQAAQDRGAAAFTVGQDIVLGREAGDVQSPSGRQRLAHELTHVVQQRARPIDPTRIEPADSTAEHEAHDVAARVTRGEPAPALRQAPVGIPRDVGWASRGPIPDPYGMGYNEILRRAGSSAEPAVRDLASCEGTGMTLDRSRFEALSPARRSAVLALQPHATGTACESWFTTLRASQLAVTMEGMQGTLYWAGSSGPDRNQGYQIRQTTTRPHGTDPIAAGTAETNVNEFATWMLGGAAPGPSSKMNCWEAVLYTAWKAGLVSEARLRQLHADAAAAANGANSGAVYMRHLLSALGGPGSTLAAAATPGRGDIIFFNGMDHVAMATGTRNAAGEREVMSLWLLPPNPAATHFVNTMQRTTIEALSRSMVQFGLGAPTVTHAPNPF